MQGNELLQHLHHHDVVHLREFVRVETVTAHFKGFCTALVPTPPTTRPTVFRHAG